MEPVLLIDFGSTYTKITAVDVENGRLLGVASAYTTVQSDIMDGLSNALEQLEQRLGSVSFSETYACSSAAGGLRMITSGLVPELTAKAAKQASLGAGAKVVSVYSYQLTEADVAEIDCRKPDIFLLTGGTDGGNEECILHNSKMLAQSKKDFPIIIAGNRSCQRECERILEGRQTSLCDNVMPSLGRLNIEPVQSKIREIFLQRIVRAKGLSRAAELISGILMPTPSALLKAMKLLSDGCEGEAGLGEAVGVDLGGATTDVYSISSGISDRINTVLKGLPEPYAKRTVEGDIGMRYSIHGIVEAAGINRVSRLAGLDARRTEELVHYLSQNTGALPESEELKSLDFALAVVAVETAVARHAGTIEQVYTPMGLTFLQSGKDLSRVRQIIVTGGALIYTKRTKEIVELALRGERQSMSLKPENARVLIDKNYIFAAMGLLSESYPGVALKIMKKELLGDGD